MADETIDSCLKCGAENPGPKFCFDCGARRGSVAVTVGKIFYYLFAAMVVIVLGAFGTCFTCVGLSSGNTQLGPLALGIALLILPTLFFIGISRGMRGN